MEQLQESQQAEMTLPDGQPMTNRPTNDLYTFFQRAFDFFNAEIFKGEVPQCLLILHRNKRSKGHYCPRRYVGPDGVKIVDEIALNPSLFDRRTVAEVLSTLVHEMCHCVIYHRHGDSDGTRQRKHHCKDWGALMKEAGLQPTSTGEPGGKETGQKVTHYIMDGGRFERLCETFLIGSMKMLWSERVPEIPREASSASPSREKPKKTAVNSNPVFAAQMFGNESPDEGYVGSLSSSAFTANLNEVEGYDTSMVQHLGYIEPEQRGQTLAPADTEGDDGSQPKAKVGRPRKFKYELREIDRQLKAHRGVFIGIFEDDIVYVTYDEGFSVEGLMQEVTEDNPPSYRVMSIGEAEIVDIEPSALQSGDSSYVPYLDADYIDVLTREMCGVGKTQGRVDFSCRCKPKVQAPPTVKLSCMVCGEQLRAEGLDDRLLNAYAFNQRRKTSD